MPSSCGGTRLGSTRRRSKPTRRCGASCAGTRGEAYEGWLTRLAEASGIATPTRAELARFDRTRKKKGSNDDWTHLQDPDAKITKMKDGRTHLAHTAEHAVDLETGAIVGVTVQDAHSGDTTTMVETLITAAEQSKRLARRESPGSSATRGITATRRWRRSWTSACAVMCRSRIAGAGTGRARPRPGRRCMRIVVAFGARADNGCCGGAASSWNGPNAHLYETGGMRRVHLRGHPNILKRLLLQVCGANLGLLMRQLTGVGTPRSLQGRGGGACRRLDRPAQRVLGACMAVLGQELPDSPNAPSGDAVTRHHEHVILDLRIAPSATGC